MTEKIRIKDIALRAGVSVGTVDRVLHKRPNVSPTALAKVEKALAEMNYQPNVYASALAYNRSYSFCLFIPQHGAETYWEEIETGAFSAMETRRDFHITVNIVYYERLNSESFQSKAAQCLAAVPDGVIIVPDELEPTRAFTQELTRRRIPFVFLDSYMPDLNPLSFFGQDSFSSGRFSARMLMLLAHRDKRIMLMKQTKDGKAMSKQQENREIGFRHYMGDNFPCIEIVELHLPLEGTTEQYHSLLEDFFTAHPDIHHGITLNSKAHIVGEFLQHTHRHDIQIMGYDTLSRNTDCLRQGSISFLVAQHTYLQGYSCVDTLFKAVVLKKEVAAVNYMPIELLTKENVDFYRRMQL